MLSPIGTESLIIEIVRAKPIDQLVQNFFEDEFERALATIRPTQWRTGATSDGRTQSLKPGPNLPDTQAVTSRHTPKLVPLEGHFRDRGVGIGAVIDRLDHELYPLCFYRSDINFLAIHAIGEGQVARGAV
jgi:hypothetical protein